MTETRQVITQGQQAVATDPNLVIVTLLGSCVSCCLWDPVAQVGGMNHMLVTRLNDTRAVSNVAGVNAMELLINAILKQGGARERLIGKVFGGAQMVAGLSDIGQANAAFTIDFLQQENISCASQSVGGTLARQIMFWPAKGTARQKFVPNTEMPIEAEVVQAPAPAVGNELELF